MLATVGAMAMLVGACGGSSSKSVATVPASTLTRAAYASSAASGYKAVMRMHETVGPLSLKMTGSGSFSPREHLGSMSMRMQVPGQEAAAIGHHLTVQAILAGPTMYMKMPALTSKLPGGKPWIEISIGAVGRASGIPGLSSLMSGTSSVNDPGQFLSYLRATSAGSVTKLGETTLAGVRTTHYHGEIDLNKLPDAVPPSSRKGVKALVATLRRQFKAGNMPIDAWIDADHLVRRIAMRYSQKLPTGQAANVAIEINFVSYGHQPKPTIPPASETTNLLSLLGGALSGA
jgi:hypothetical protein